jgi:peptidoglycan/LPS O-acetylase OafA/YrhL
MSAAEGQKRFDFLDVARGAAALLVLLEHGLHQCLPGYAAFSRANLVIGQSAILVFFMISGFVIPMSLEGGTNATFWRRRFFRLFPVYWFSIALAFAYVCVGQAHPNVRLGDWRVWLSNLVLMQRWLGHPNVWEVFWSLHFEVAFYVVCSLLSACGLLRRIGARTFAWLLVGFALACTARLLRTKNPTDDAYNYLIVLSSLFGMAAHRYTAGRMSRRAFYGLLAGLFGVMFFVWGVNHHLYPAVATHGQLIRIVVVGGVGYGAFVWLLELRGRTMPWPACWLGRRSYPIYLVHPFVLLLLTHTDWPTWAFLPCLIGGALLLAELTHRFVERPGIDLGRMLEKRREPAAAPAVLRRAA